MEALRPFQHWNAVDVERHMVTQHHVTTVYSDTSDHMDGIIGAIDKEMADLKEDLFFAMKFVHEKLFKHYPKVSAMTLMFLMPT